MNMGEIRKILINVCFVYFVIIFFLNFQKIIYFSQYFLESIPRNPKFEKYLRQWHGLYVIIEEFI